MKQQLDSLLIEAENLNVCEECESKDWKWVKIRQDYCNETGFIPYHDDMDTSLVFKIADEYNSLANKYYISQYIIDTLFVDGEIEALTVIPPSCPYFYTQPRIYVECQNGTPVVVRSF